jgi:hypothetical protein
VVKVFPDHVKSGAVPGPAHFGAFFIDGGIDLIVPTSHQGGEGPFLSVIASETGEIVMGIDINEHLLTHMFKTACLEHRLGQILRGESVGKFKNMCNDLFLGDSRSLFKNRFTELVDQILPVGIKCGVKHDMISFDDCFLSFVII